MIDMINRLKMIQFQLFGSKGEQINKQNNYYGLGYKDTKDLCQDLIKEQLDVFKRDAAIEAEKRFNSFLDSFFGKLSNDNISGECLGEVFRSPDMQYTYVEAQKAYIRSGDKDLEEVLTDLLVGRVKEKERTLLQIVLREAISIVPMLLPKQLDVLALCFYLKYTVDDEIDNTDRLFKWLDEECMPFLTFAKEANNMSFFTHLTYTKVGSIEIASYELEDFFKMRYGGLFSVGHNTDEIKLYRDKYPDLIFPCTFNEKRWQIKAVNENDLNKKLNQYPNMTEHDKKMLAQLFNVSMMSGGEIINMLCKHNPDYCALFDVWKNSLLQNLSLTPVGFVLGAMRIKMITGKVIDMRIWI